jgi:hypothetical protein
MPISLRFGFTQNLADYLLNIANVTPFPFLDKPLKQFLGNAKVEIDQIDNTNKYVKPEK